MPDNILDRVAAQYAQRIVSEATGQTGVAASDVDNLVTKSLGVLQENGVYAFYLFLLSRSNSSDKAVAKVIREKLVTLARNELGYGGEVHANDAVSLLAYASETLCNNLDKLLLLVRVYQQTLIYARYGAKASA